jgi:hypothetical protein
LPAVPSTDAKLGRWFFGVARPATLNVAAWRAAPIKQEMTGRLQSAYSEAGIFAHTVVL